MRLFTAALTTLSYSEPPTQRRILSDQVFCQSLKGKRHNQSGISADRGRQELTAHRDAAARTDEA